jgi:large subunit ribosomal protein L15
MIALDKLKNVTRPAKRYKRVGRGPGSGLGKTCGRGEKGAGSRSGYTHRYGYEGGQFRLFMKLPIRGFSNARFRKRLDVINLEQINAMFEEGDTVNVESLVKRGFINSSSHGIKILGNGELKKHVKIEAKAISKSVREKLQKSKIDVTVD